MSNSNARRKSVILNSMLLTAASVPCLSSPATRRNSVATNDNLEELIRATQRQGRRASEFAKTNKNPAPDIGDKNIYSHEGTEQNKGPEKKAYGFAGWSSTLLEDDKDFSARAMSLSMAGLLSRLRQVLGMAREVVQDGNTQIRGDQEDLLDIVKQIVGGNERRLDTTEELSDWISKGFPEDGSVDKRNNGKEQQGKGWHRQQSMGWKEEEINGGETQIMKHQDGEENQDWENHNMSEPEEETDITLHEDGAWDDEFTDSEENSDIHHEKMEIVDMSRQEAAEKNAAREKKNVAIEGEREVENYNSIPFNPHHLGPRPVVKKSVTAQLDISTLTKALAKKPTNDGEFLRCLLDIQKYTYCRQHRQKMTQLPEQKSNTKTASGQNIHYNFVRFGK